MNEAPLQTVAYCIESVTARQNGELVVLLAARYCHVHAVAARVVAAVRVGFARLAWVEWTAPATGYGHWCAVVVAHQLQGVERLLVDAAAVTLRVAASA